MGWIRTCRLSVFGAAAVLGGLLLFARSPIGADEKKAEKKPAAGSVARPATTPSASQTPTVSPPIEKAAGPNINAAVPPPVPGTVFVDVANQVFVSTTTRARFNFKIDPKTPVKDLLPIPPASRPLAAPVLEDDLTRVPEISFQQPFARNLPPQKALENTAHTIAKINHVNQKKNDAFMEVLLGSRADLKGVPFAMSDSCRLKQERSKHFQQALNTVRQAMGQSPSLNIPIKSGSFGLVTPSFAAPTTPAPPPPIPSQAIAPPQASAQPVSGTRAIEPVRTAVGGFGEAVPAPPTMPASPADERGNRVGAAQFWQRYREACLREDNANAKYEPPFQQHVIFARIAALMQILAPETASMRKGLVAYLATLSHPEATRALAKMAIFSKERSVREAACDALKVRRERDYTEILLSGLHYPWPAVAKHAAEAIVKLERKDLIPQLVAVLEEPDPRLPTVKRVGEKSEPAVRELVKVNHHRNCLMCHAPVHNIVQQAVVERVAQEVNGKVTTKVIRREVPVNEAPPEVPTAQVPIPGEPLPTPSQGYDSSNPDILVRLDVTYLRQDFSELQSVADAHPWPEMQRFDFLVRTRTLTEDEAQVYRDKLSTREPGRVTPYQRAALAALRDLTGRDTEPTAQAWRRLLEITER